MELFEQFSTVEQSIRLVELGVKPVALFYHMPAKDGPHRQYIQYGWSSEAIAPAYSVAELGTMLPFYVSSGKNYINTFDCFAEGTITPFRQRRATEADARAAMLIQLLEDNQLILPDHWQQDPNDPCADGRCKLSYSKDMEEIKPLPEVAPGEENIKEFSAVWKVLQHSTMTLPAYYRGYQEVTGQHVKLIVDAIKEAK